ncbi:lactonase family protein [Methylomonas sp. MgM2]
MKNRARLMVLGVLVSALASGVCHAKNKAKETVYTLSNDANHNAVLAFDRDNDGYLHAAGQFDTGGTGTGGGLGNQGALALSKNERYLFAVNAGSDEVSVFRVSTSGLELLDKAQVSGDEPVSVTVDHNLVYVVNAGDDSIFGFRFDPRSGQLHPLPESYRALSAPGSAPAQISFNHEGNALAITEKATNKITTFALDDNGLPATRHTLDSAGVTPFGFSFGKRDQFFVAEAAGGSANASTVSSYEIMEDGTVHLLDGAVAVGQTAACWLTTTPNGRIAFTANTPADSISSFAIDRAGNLTLLKNIAAQEDGPRDMAISDDGRTLYTLNGGSNSIGVYRVLPKGKLQKLQSIAQLPAGFTGLVVR